MKENFDDYIKNKLNQRQFEFDEDNWLKAASLLDQEDKGKKRGFVWWYSGAAILLLALITIGWYYTNSNNNIGLSPKTVINTTEEIPSHKLGEQLSETSNETLDQKTDSKNNSITDTKSENSKKLDHKSSILKSMVYQPTFNNKPFASTNKPTVTSYPLFGQNTRKETPVTLPKTKSISNEIAKMNSILLNAISSRLNLFDIPTSELTTSYLDADILKHTQEISAHPNKLQFALRASILGIPKTFKNMSFSGGIAISYPFSNHWAIHTEANYVNQFYDFDAIKSARRIFYTFGKNIVDDALTPERLHQIEIPLYFSYRFGKHPYKHQINMGASVGKLIQVGGKVISTMNAESKTTNTGKIVTDAFNTTNFKALIGYEFHLNKRFNIGLRGSYQLFDLGNPDFENKVFIQKVNNISKYKLELATKIRLY